ncbi:unnamed protein product [Rotaria magnacalcarata]|nr:unnamed protein product [Rotaria magnacalcarata]CAF4484423.1 unnamed protein product [Rotaria socialis]CAF4745990.1 unnamed protein product [Rotaria socialis]CAF4873376.1 unnamed protein product [Rotaria socialis]
MFKNNKRDDYLGIYLTTQEYQLWMLHPYDKNGKEILFQGIRYCMNDNTCQCGRCKKTRINEWPYERSLCANLLYLTGIHIKDINYNEIIKFEETLVSDYLRHIGEF